MDMAFKRGKGKCELTVSNYSVPRQYSFIWTFPKHWRYTDAVNRKYIFLNVINEFTKLLYHTIKAEMVAGIGPHAILEIQ